MSDKKKTADELAAEVAEEMFKGGRHGHGDQPRTANTARMAPDPLEKAGGAGAMPTEMSGALGGLAVKAPGAPLAKADEEEEGKKEPKKEEEGEEEGEEEAEKGKTCKSDDEIDADALIKSMDALEAAAEGIEESETDRRAELAKALDDGTLTDSERIELLELLGASEPTPAADAVRKSEDADDEVDPMDKGFSDVFQEEFQDDYDVSPFLEKFGIAMGAGMDILREDLSKSGNDQRLFNKALAKSFRGVATVISRQEDMIKSLAAQNSALATRLGIVEQQPLQRKSAASPGQAKPLQKSFADQEPGLNREQIFNGLHLLMGKYKGTGGRAKNGEPIDRAVSSFELTGSISKSMLEEVKDALGGK